ncbi:MAG TPA: hypothetical protein VN641_04695 [Urbifossiella sp.]|nr:hypothetical protein [Urbifossiella sp.]
MNPGKNGTHALHALGAPKRLICLDYYDGPIEGVVQFGEPDRVFLIRQVGVVGTVQDEIGEHGLHPLPADALDRMAAAISPYIEPSWPMWFPIWKFPSPQIEESVNPAVDDILAQAGPETQQMVIDFFSAFEPTKTHAI